MAKDLTFVPVVESSKKTFLHEDIDEGYQRPASATRMRRFSEYLEHNPLRIVPPVILSGRGHWTFDDSRGVLVINERAAIH